MNTVIHKQGRKTIEIYAGFGTYEQMPIPLCVKPKRMYSGKGTYTMHRLWKYVTCKHCLRKRNEN